jgi:hypothetical protein
MIANSDFHFPTLAHFGERIIVNALTDNERLSHRAV